MVTRETEVRKIGRGLRNDELVAGFERYHRVACKLARKHYLPWFPTKEDLVQASALAAAEALAELGEQTTLKKLCPLVLRVLYQQAAAYGLCLLKNNKTGIRQKTRREFYLCEILKEDDYVDHLEFHRGAIGVSEFTAKASRQLHRLVNLPELEDTTSHHKTELRERMYQVLDSDPELQILRDWYLSRSCYFGYDTMQQEGLWNRNKGHR